MTWSFFRDKQRSKRNKKRNHRVAAPGRRRPRFEELEHRQLLAVLMVNTLDDTAPAADTVLTLREAILKVNDPTFVLSPQELTQVDATTPFGTNDTIVFKGNLFAPAGQQMISLLAANGDLDITESVTIDGPGLTELLISAGGNSRIFNIAASVGDVTLQGLTLSEGDPGAGENGGAILSEAVGLLTIADSEITGNAATDGSGGGVFATGDLVLTATTVGGPALLANSATDNGGGIYALGSVTLKNNSIVAGNTADVNGGGIYSSGNVSLDNSKVTDNNTSDGDGGGIYAQSVNLVNSTVSGNETGTDDAGGGIFAIGDVMLKNSTVSGNTAGGGGGGILSAIGSVSLENSTVGGIAAIDGNKANNGEGGGIWAAFVVTLQNSTVSENEAKGSNSSGGGILAPRVTLKNSTVSGNKASGDGGGIAGNDVTIQNSTIANNTADAGNSGATPADGIGGGVSASTRFKMQNSIVIGNSDTGNGKPDLSIPTGSASTVRFSLIGDKTGLPGGAQFTVSGPTAPNDFGNFIGMPGGADAIPLTAAAGTKSAFGSAAGAGTLVVNDVTPPTFALTTDSIAIDTGKNSLATPASLGDERGLPFVRIFGANVDMGAYEFQTPPASNPVPVLNAPIPDQSAVAGSLFDFIFAANTFTDDDALTYTATLSPTGALPSWLGFTQGTNARRFFGIPPITDIGTVYNIRVTATDSEGAMRTDDFLLTVVAAPVIPPVAAELPVNETFENPVVPPNIAPDARIMVKIPSFSTITTNPVSGTASLQAERQTVGSRPLATVDFLNPATASTVTNVKVDVQTLPGNGSSLWSNALVTFDYQSPTNYKFAGVFEIIDRLIIGQVVNGSVQYRAQKVFTAASNTTIPLNVTINRTTRLVTLTSGATTVMHTFATLGTGTVGVGTINANAKFDNLMIS